MNKLLSLLILLLGFSLSTVAQSNAFVDYGEGSGIPGVTSSPLTKKEWSKLYRTTEAEDWKKLAKLTFTALAKFPDDNSVEKGLVRYMHLYAISGLYASNKITKELALEKAKQHLTKTVTVPPHIVCASSGNNCYTMDGVKLKILLTNYKETYKHLVSVINPMEKINLNSFGDKDIYSFGRLEMVSTSSEARTGFDLIVGGAQVFARPKKK